MPSMYSAHVELHHSPYSQLDGRAPLFVLSSAHNPRHTLYRNEPML
jgi:hypothetical protein